MVVALLCRVYDTAVRVPGDAVGSVRNGGERHGIEFVAIREALPRSPSLEILDDRPNAVRLVVLHLGDIGLEALHVTYRSRDALLQRIRIHSVHRIDLRHEHVSHFHERAIARNGVAAVHHVSLTGYAPRVYRIHSVHPVVYLLRRVVHRSIVSHVPRKDRRMLAQVLHEVRAGDPHSRPRLEAILVGKVEKLLLRACLIRMDEVEAGVGHILHRLFEAVSVHRKCAQPVETDREERLAADERHAIVTKLHTRKRVVLIPEIEHLLGFYPVASFRIRKRDDSLVDAVSPLLFRTVRQDGAVARELRRGILAVY